jgi:cullin-associated NEDD8-dissociated protein 1
MTIHFYYQVTLEILAEVISRFGDQMTVEHETIMSACVVHLTSSQAALRKRSSQCIASLSYFLNDSLLNGLITSLVKLLADAKKSSKGPEGVDVTIIQTVGSISRIIGFRLGPYIPTVLPLFISYCPEIKTKEGDDDEEDIEERSRHNEIRENCMYAIESFIIRCPAEVDSQINRMCSLMLQYVKYDPNYNECDEGYEEEEGEEEEEDDYMSDDDDNSWKVRKAAVKVGSTLFPCIK